MPHAPPPQLDGDSDGSARALVHARPRTGVAKRSEANYFSRVCSLGKLPPISSSVPSPRQTPSSYELVGATGSVSGESAEEGQGAEGEQDDRSDEQYTDVPQWEIEAGVVRGGGVVRSPLAEQRDHLQHAAQIIRRAESEQASGNKAAAARVFREASVYLMDAVRAGIVCERLGVECLPGVSCVGGMGELHRQRALRLAQLCLRRGHALQISSTVRILFLRGVFVR